MRVGQKQQKKSDSSENETEITRMPTLTPSNTESEKEKRGLGVEEVPVVTQAAYAELPQEKTDDDLADSKDKEPKDVIKLFAHFICKLSNMNRTAPIVLSLE